MTETAAKRLAADPAVAYVEQNQTVVAATPPRPAPPGAWTASTSATCR